LSSLDGVSVIAAGKAVGGMAGAFATGAPVRIARAVIVGAPAPASLLARAAAHEGAHPGPDARSVQAGRDALALAAEPQAAALVVLLSGGASAMLAVPATGLSLDDKREATRRLLAAGVDIHDVNCVRKHLSAIKGGWLAAACAVPVLTWAISDVIGDDPAVIGSGPTVPDRTTYRDALAVLDRAGGRAAYPRGVLRHLERGARGEIDETPKPDDVRLQRSETHVIGAASDALEAAAAAAGRLGYRVVIRDRPAAGEARETAAAHVAELAALAAHEPAPLCVLSTGETTVRVTGTGRGGRNQEYALAAALRLEAIPRPVMLTSLGTDGIDGPTDAAGAFADTSTVARARARGLEPMQYLDANDAWTFFDILGDLVRTGATGTNVGDLQVALVAPAGPQPRQEAL
jgi:hydroxypyruvate reductase